MRVPTGGMPKHAHMQMLPDLPIMRRVPGLTVPRDALKIISLKAWHGSKAKCNYRVMTKRLMDISEAVKLINTSLRRAKDKRGLFAHVINILLDPRHQINRLLSLW